MSWSRSRPNGGKTAAKYTTPEHRATRTHLMTQLQAAGTGVCAEPICVMRSRLITPTMALHLCHDRHTGQVRGLGHARCNTVEAAKYARSKQNPPRSFTRPTR